MKLQSCTVYRHHHHHDYYCSDMSNVFTRPVPLAGLRETKVKLTSKEIGVPSSENPLKYAMNLNYA